MKVYGDTYIGDKDRTTYMEYTQDKGVDIKGMFHIEKGSTGWKNMEGLPDEIQAAADLAQEAKDAIDNAAVGSVNLLRNSGFTGDYETEDLSALPSYRRIPNFLASNWNIGRVWLPYLRTVMPAPGTLPQSVVCPSPYH